MKPMFSFLYVDFFFFFFFMRAQPFYVSLSCELVVAADNELCGGD